MNHSGDGEITLKKVGTNESTKPMISLTIQERLLIGNLLPDKGSILTLTVADDLSKKIRFTQEEIKECTLEYDETLKTYSWNLNKSVYFDITDQEKSLLQKQIEKLDKEESIPMALFALVKKIKEFK